MKEIFFNLPFHLIFYKHPDWMIIPCISYLPKNKEQHIGNEIVFGFLRWRMSIYFHNGN